MDELIAAHLRWCRNKNHLPRSLADRKRALEQAARQLPFGIAHANEDDIREWLDNPRWKPATKTIYWSHLRQLYRWGVRVGVLDIDPMLDIDRPKPPEAHARPVDLDLADELLSVLPEPWNTFVLLARGEGLRCCEIGGLRREDITPALVTIRNAKGGRVGRVPTHPAVWERVRSMTGSIAEAVGGRADGRWISIRTANYFRFRMKMPGVSLHRFRHLYACELRRQGYDLFAVKQLMRHRSINSTQIYVDVGNEELARAVTSLPIPTSEPRKEAGS